MKFHKDGTLPTIGKPDIVFVFGSNLSGIHGAGAARVAFELFGAKLKEGVGLYGRSYAIPTKDHRIKKMRLSAIKPHIQNFVEFANRRPDLEFFITRVGCGLAGYKDSDIAPLFKGLGSNCSISHEWKKYIGEE